MSEQRRLAVSLLLLRLSVLLVMLIWTLDKFFNPGHAATVYEKFYFLEGFGPAVMYTLGGVELIVLAGFLIGFQKRITYGLVLLFHAVSTLSSFPQYLDPFGNLLFFAAWPMLAACVALYLLREKDTLLSMNR